LGGGLLGGGDSWGGLLGGGLLGGGLGVEISFGGVVYVGGGWRGVVTLTWGRALGGVGASSFVQQSPAPSHEEASSACCGLPEPGITEHANAHVHTHTHIRVAWSDGCFTV